MSKLITGSLVISSGTGRVVFVPVDFSFDSKAKDELPSHVLSDSAKMQDFCATFRTKPWTQTAAMNVLVVEANEEALYEWFGCHQIRRQPECVSSETHVA